MLKQTLVTSDAKLALDEEAVITLAEEETPTIATVTLTVTDMGTVPTTKALHSADLQSSVLVIIMAMDGHQGTKRMPLRAAHASLRRS